MGLAAWADRMGINVLVAEILAIAGLSARKVRYTGLICLPKPFFLWTATATQKVRRLGSYPRGMQSTHQLTSCQSFKV